MLSLKVIAANTKTCLGCAGPHPSGTVILCPLDQQPIVGHATTGEGCGKGLLRKSLTQTTTTTDSPIFLKTKQPCSTCGKLAKGSLGLAKVAAQAVGIPVDVAGRDLEAERLRKCTACTPGAALCPDCDCIIKLKIKIKSEKCPRGLW